MSGGRPRTAISTFGNIHIRASGRRFVAATRYRDLDGRLRKVSATANSKAAASALLKERLASRSGFGSGGMLGLASPFCDLTSLWLADLELRDLTDNTKQNYRDDLQLHIMPAFEHYALGEITTGRVEWFLKSEAAISYSRAKHSRTMLNLLFGFALRHDAIPRNPVEGTSPLKKPKRTPEALSLAQIAAIRRAATTWRAGADFKGPKPDGQVRDLIEVLLGTALRPGEALALRVCDVDDSPKGMVIEVRGTVVLKTGHGVIRQDHPKTEHSIRRIAVPEFAAAVIRRRIQGIAEPEQTIFANRTGGPLSPYNVRRTFRAFLELAGLSESGITLRWYRRTGATVIARGASVDAAAAFLGHGSPAITEGHYIEPDRTIDYSPARLLESTLRAVNPDGILLVGNGGADEAIALDKIDDSDDEAE